MPGANLVLDAGTLYGHAQGGTFNSGALFSLRTDGSSYSNFYSFINSTSYYGAVGNLIITEGTFPAPAARAAYSDDVLASGQENETQFSPNPFVDDFSIRVKSRETEDVSFAVINIQGAEVSSAQGVSNETYQLGNNLSTGIYILKVVKGNQIKFYRVVKK
jgi:hypothetical protein